MKFNLRDWLIGMAAIAVFFAALSVINDTKRDDRMVSCEVNQNGQVHILPCRLVASYLASVEL